jgi:hypothetical protein
MLEYIMNHADHFYLFPEAILLSSFCLDRFKVGRLCKFRPNVPVCVWSLFRPFRIRFYCRRHMLEHILNHADHFYLFPEAILLTSLCLDRFKVGRLCKNRPNVHT